MIIGCAYAITVVVTYLEQYKLYNKFTNQLYKDKYVAKKDNTLKENIKEIIKWFIPVYNVVSSTYDLNHFDKYYEREKNKLIKSEKLEKIEIIYSKTAQKEIEYRSLVDESTITISKQENSLNNLVDEEVEYVMEKPKQYQHVKNYRRY